MPTPIATADYMKLSVSERIQLVEDIWDSIAANAPNTVDLSQAQKAELHRRVAAHRADPSTAVPWEQVRSLGSSINMDAHDSVSKKVQELFSELVGARGVSLKGDVPAREVKDVLGLALSEYLDPLVADELAFHLVDWNSDAAFIVAVLLFPERFTKEELQAGVDMFLCHAPAHVMAAARLGGHAAKDIFLDENAT